MPLTETFLLATNAELTTEFSGTLNLTHKTDLSDNPQDFTLYFGSLSTVDRVLQAASNPGVDNIVISIVDTLPEWEASTAYTLGQHAQPTTPNGKRYEISTAGTTGGSEPTWPTSPIGATVNDGSATWMLMGAKHEVEEIKLATTSGGLTGATGGASLSLGAEIESGEADAVEIHIRVTNAVTNVGNNIIDPDIKLSINEIQESEA
jgi:hypothetical protein